MKKVRDEREGEVERERQTEREEQGRRKHQKSVASFSLFPQGVERENRKRIRRQREVKPTLFGLRGSGAIWSLEHAKHNHVTCYSCMKPSSDRSESASQGGNGRLGPYSFFWFALPPLGVNTHVKDKDV